MKAPSLAASNARVGDEMPPLNVGPIRPLTLALFAGGSGDHNPIHLDRDVAASAGFADVFAHGMLSMAYAGRALTDWAGPTSVRRINVRFAAITPIGATVVCRGRVTALETTEQSRLATVALTVEADGQTSLVGDAIVRLE